MKKWIDKYRSFPIQVKASFWFLICSIIQKGISVFTTPIFTRLMNPDVYGKFNSVLAWQGILASIIILTLPWGVVEQGVIKYSDKRDEFMSASLGLMTFLSVVWFIFFLVASPLWCIVLKMPQIQVVAVFVITWSSSVFTFWSINQRIDYKYKRLVILTVAVAIVKPVVGVILVSNFDDKVTARVLGIAGVELLAYIVLFIHMMAKGRTFYSRKIWSYVFRFNILLVPHYLSQRLLNSSDRIMIDRMCKPGDAGLYSLAYSLSVIMLFVNQALQSAVNPWIYQKLKDGKSQELKKVVYPAMMIVALLNLLLIAFAPEVILLFAPTKYYDAIWVIPPVAMSNFFMFLYGFFANVEFYYEKTGMMSVATVIGAALNVGLNFIFIRKFGYYAAGYTTLFCYIVYAFSHYVFMENIRKEKLRGTILYDRRILVGMSAAFMSVGFAISVTYKYPVVRYGIILILLTIIILNYKKAVSLFSIRKNKD